MQILRVHAAELFGRRPMQLTAGQRYHFLAGWLPWMADGLNVVFNLFALVWALLMVTLPKIDAPLAVFSVLPLSLFVFKLAKLMHLYHVRVGAGARQTIAASIAGLGLAHTIGFAVLKGALTRNEPFFRTPKQAHAQSLWGAVQACREEALMAAGLLLGAWAVTANLENSNLDRMRLSGPDLKVWVAVMIVQSIPYLSAVAVSIISALPIPARWVGHGYAKVETDEEYATILDAPPPVASSAPPSGA
jgi:hypothetical protein